MVIYKSSLKILVGAPSVDVFTNILLSKDEQLKSKPSLRILFAGPMKKRLSPVGSSLLKMRSANSGMDTGHLANTL